mmetsp:Transcript_73270/g.136936  ORF Transcript_73270/g.136936 Transcript_73270/m.136936 type:complete len:250 (-) Transcript_73270:86-835(-)
MAGCKLVLVAVTTTFVTMAFCVATVVLSFTQTGSGTDVVEVEQDALQGVITRSKDFEDLWKEACESDAVRWVSPVRVATRYTQGDAVTDVLTHCPWQAENTNLRVTVCFIVPVLALACCALMVAADVSLCQLRVAEVLLLAFVLASFAAFVLDANAVRIGTEAACSDPKIWHVQLGMPHLQYQKWHAERTCPPGPFGWTVFLDLTVFLSTSLLFVLMLIRHFSAQTGSGAGLKSNRDADFASSIGNPNI